MKGKNFSEIVDLIVREDSRYEKEAYLFIRHALDYTLKMIQGKEQQAQSRHISGQELCDGIKAYALEQYGPLSFTLLKEWGITQTEDFGEIVFNLVEYEVFGKTDKDSRDDFKSVFEFEETFLKPFEPKLKRSSSEKKKSSNPSPSSNS